MGPSKLLATGRQHPLGLLRKNGMSRSALPLYIAEVHGAPLAVDGVELIGEPLSFDRRDPVIPVNSASFEDQKFGAAVGLNPSAALCLIE